MRWPWLILGCLLLGGCADTKKLSKQQLAHQPSWVTKRPVSDAWFTGIGIGEKRYSDYKEQALKNALNDLASQIEVTVAANTYQYTIEREGEIKEFLGEDILITTLQELEGYELAGAWEDKQYYYLYYRLSKAAYFEAMAEKKNKAVTMAAESYRLARQNLEQGKIVDALSNYLNAIDQLYEYLDEPTEISFEGKTINLSVVLIDELNGLLNQIKITSKREIYYGEAGWGIDELADEPIMVLANYWNDGDKIALNGLPLVVSDWEDDVTGGNTDNKGQFQFPIKRLPKAVGMVTYPVRIDFEPLLLEPCMEKDKKVFFEKLMQLMGEVKVQVSPIEVFVQVSESAALKDELESRLSDQGFHIAKKKEKADILFSIWLNQKEGFRSNDFHVIYLEMDLQVLNTKTGKVLFSETKTDFKGVHLDYDKAVAKALEEVEGYFSDYKMRRIEESMSRN